MLNALTIHYLLINRKPVYSSPTPIKKVPNSLKTCILQCLQQKDATLREIYEHLNQQYKISTINGVLGYLVKEQKVSTIITNGIKKYKYNI